MNRTRLVMVAVCAASALAACGGGSDGTQQPEPRDPIVITGLAASGAALANAALTAKCAAGSPISGTTAADGTFVIKLEVSHAVPCMLEIGNGTTILYGIAVSAGHVNVTPLTDLVIAKAFGFRPSAVFADFGAAVPDGLDATLATAETYVKSELSTLTGGAPSGSLLTGTFRIGDADDRRLDALAALLDTHGKSLGDLRLAATSGAPLAAALARGGLVDPAAVITTLAVATIDESTSASGLQALTGKAKCDVKVVALNYDTVGVAGEKTNASGVMLVPQPTAGNCTGPAGLVAYAKGTDVQKPRTLANPADPETFLLVAMYAAQGYAVVATDYLGFARSAYAYHPYLHADSEATAVIDAIRAARNAATSAGATLSGKVMVTGYSQGGHSSMAAHRAIERDHAREIDLVAGAHLAGPYNLTGAFKSSVVIAGVQFFVPYLVTSWQKAYNGALYSDVATVFKLPYANYIESLLPSATHDYTTLVTSGLLPGGPGVTPTQARDALFQAAFVADVQTNDRHPVFTATRKNDLLGWSPKSKLLLCGGAGDPTVPPAIHQHVLKADFDSRGLSNVVSVDVDAAIQATYGPGGAAPTDPSSDAFAIYYGSYHGTYEPPFCHLQAKALFDSAN